MGVKLDRSTPQVSDYMARDQMEINNKALGSGFSAVIQDWLKDTAEIEYRAATVDKYAQRAEDRSNSEYDRRTGDKRTYEEGVLGKAQTREDVLTADERKYKETTDEKLYKRERKDTIADREYERKTKLEDKKLALQSAVEVRQELENYIVDNPDSQEAKMAKAKLDKAIAEGDAKKADAAVNEANAKIIEKTGVLSISSKTNREMMSQYDDTRYKAALKVLEPPAVGQPEEIADAKRVIQEIESKYGSKPTTPTSNPGATALTWAQKAALVKQQNR